MLKKTLVFCGLASLALTTTTTTALSQAAPAARAEVPADGAPEAMQSLFQALELGQTEVSVPGAEWLQLQFSSFALGAEGKITVSDGTTQQDLTQDALEASEGRTVIFNGDSVTVSMEGEDLTRATLSLVTVGLPPQGTNESVDGVTATEELKALFGGMLQNYVVRDDLSLLRTRPSSEGVGEPETICGNVDNRGPSTDARVGRIMPIGCTGWIVNDDQILTAGHCISSATQLIQFNVPASTANGTPVAPGAQHQYTIDQSSITFENTGIGNDWAMLRVFPNTQTGNLPRAAQGTSFALTNTANPANIRITGFGVDGPAPTFGRNGPRDATNQTNQTHSGGVTSHTPSSSNNSVIRYTADTMGGNSGSPVIDLANPGTAVGIHTNGGCFSAGGANQGTSFRNQATWAAVGPRSWVSAASNDPAWSDNTGWADVTNYSTIQALNVGGDLFFVARANAGMLVQRLNAATGQWQRLATNDPAFADDNGWSDVTNYSTIQAVDVGGVLHLVARANAGIIVNRWTGSGWQRLATNDPAWGDNNGWADVTNYSTIQALDVGGELHLVARANAGIIAQRWTGSGWQRLASNDPRYADDNGWADISNYATIQALDVGGELHLVARANAGIHVNRWTGSGWQRLAANDPAWADNNGWADVTNYSTIQALDVGGVLHLVARANAGMIVNRWTGSGWQRLATNDPRWADDNGWADVTNHSTIKAFEHDGDLHLMARANAGIHLLRWRGSGWETLARNTPSWSDSLGWADQTNYATIEPVSAGGSLYLTARANRGMITLRLP